MKLNTANGLFAAWMALSCLFNIVSGQNSTSCYTNLTEIAATEYTIDESQLGTIRTYVLCPNTVFDTGFQDNDGNIVQGQLPILLRTNMQVLCGEDGARSNNCTIQTGSFGFFLDLNYADTNPNGDGALMQGITFQGFRTGAGIFYLWGKVQVIDCLFHNSRNLFQVVLDYGDTSRRRTSEATPGTFHWLTRNGANRRLAKSVPDYHSHKTEARALQNEILEVDFIDCDFLNNSLANDQSNFPGVVTVATSVNTATFKRCNFDGNNFAPSGVIYTYIIENSYGGGLSIDSCCFSNNSVINDGGIVMTYDVPPISVSNNFGTSGNVPCEFLGYVENYTASTESVCTDFDADTCQSDAPVGPTVSPTIAPTTGPTVTMAPTVAVVPTVSPSGAAMSPGPTMFFPAPTLKPVSEAPTSGGHSVQIIPIVTVVACAMFGFMI